jgi:hypothetical protein
LKRKFAAASVEAIDRGERPWPFNVAQILASGINLDRRAEGVFGERITLE